MTSLYDQEEAVKAYGDEKKEEGVERLSKLISAMMAAGKGSDIERVTTDKAFRDKQFALYGL